MMHIRRIFIISVLTLLGVFYVSPSVKADVNAFRIVDYKIDYYLSKNSEQRSTLKTVESITAEFPQFDQNHGIERSIPKSFDGHKTRLVVNSVTDAAMRPMPYTTYENNGNEVVRIGDANEYVHGLVTYVITYTQQDVTRFFEDTKSDEFYWDTNGGDWPVPIDTLHVQLHIDKQLAAAYKDTIACYEGVFGSTQNCTITPIEDGFAVTATGLLAQENVTIAVGFTANTFAPYKMTRTEKFINLWQKSLVLTAPFGTIATVLLLVLASRWSNRKYDVGPIAPEYLPPKDASVATSSVILGKYNKVFAAQLIDLAVRHYIAIYQTREKSLFRSPKYEIEIKKDIASLRDEEQELLKDIFDNPVVGARLDMSSLKRNYAVTNKLSDNQKKLTKNITGPYNLRARDAVRTGWFKRSAGVLSIIALATLSPWLAISALIALITAITLKPLTEHGLATYRYLKGLEMYIGAAETERLAMLQSPEGAEKARTPVDANDTRALVKLYERVLPYAILFGQEKQWNKQLGDYYATTQSAPTWYHGMQPFNPAAFSSTISQFNTSATYSSPSSSSSGGSGGGGFSGGGGGGGGGGGW